MILHHSQDVFQISEGIQVIRLCCFRNAVDDRTGFRTIDTIDQFRKMSNQLLADETRKARQKLSAIILNNLDGWEDEYEQIRKDGRL